MHQFKLSGATLATALLVAACGGGGGGDPFGTQIASPERGQLMQSPPALITSLTASSFKTSLSASASGQSLLQLSTGSATGDLPCGVDVQYIKYGTVGGAGEKTDASGALMTPTAPPGSTAEVLAKCTGARPIVLYGHGTNISKRYNLAEIADNTNPANSESVLLAAMYAAQGFIVVAPNYAGYDSSSLSYHPYVNADQQSKDMIDALAAAKSALPTLTSHPTASTKLFVTGYSQGGFAAMATVRAMQALPTPIPVTASAPMSGPYAMSAYTDFIFMGGVALGSTAFAPMLTTSYQKSYGGIYSSPSDYFESTYATGIESLIPGSYDFTSVFSSGKLPQTALFSNVTTDTPALASVTPLVTGTSSDALFAKGVGTPNLIKNSARLSFVADAMTHGFDGALPSAMTGAAQTLQLATGVTHPLRLAAQKNDLRAGWTGPLNTSPMLLCGGNGDPTVFFNLNTQVMAGVWGAKVLGHVVTVLDVDSSPTSASDPFAAAKVGFTTTKTNTYTAAYNAAIAANKSTTEATVAAATAVTTAYHGSLVPPFCNAAARGFFNQFLAAGL
jgi:Prolyl oligopeptidase family